MEKYSRNLSILTSEKKVQLANDVIFYLFTTKRVNLTIMLVTGFKSVIVLDEQCVKVRAETPEITKIFWTFVFYGKWRKNVAFFLCYKYPEYKRTS